MTVAEKNGYFDNVEITAAPDSRLFDPYDPDCEPLPPDDPNSHRLMHRVDGHAGWPHWHDKGDAPAVDAGTWLNSLPRDANGDIVLSLADSVRVARKNSREYQTELEDLYLSALDVTFERFRFNAQFFAGNTTTATFDGKDRSGTNDTSTLNVNNHASMRKLSATGGELIVGLANSLVWQFSGQNTETIGSLFNFSFVQPLLRFGGRARVLEGLTQSERTLLANVRQMEQFRRGFYVEIAAGKNSGDGPSRTGPVGQNGLGLLAGLAAGRAGATPLGGFLGVLQEQQQIRNRAVNLKMLGDAVEQMQFTFEAGRLLRLQVDQTRQAYYSAESNLMTSKAGYATRLDQFKITLGLPPSLPLKLEDPLFDQFNLSNPELITLRDDIDRVLNPLRTKSIPTANIELEKRHQELLGCEERLLSQLKATQADLDKLLATWPARAERLAELGQRIVRDQYDADEDLFVPEFVRGRIDQHAARLRDNGEKCQQFLAAIRAVTLATIRDKPEEARDTLQDLAIKLSAEVYDLVLTQASIHLEAIDLVPVSVGEPQALETARNYRLDWMNARANLVDSWRKIEFEGNALQSGLNIFVNGDLGTRGDNPAEFTTDKGRLQMGVDFDTPITRLAERNRYREALINFQRARRSYMLFEDQISQSLRNTLRIIDLTQINFEIRRAAVLVAISQVTQARLRLIEPAKVGAANQASPTTARDLVSALSDLLDSQNDLLNAWVGFEVLRVLLDFEMGTMQLNNEGLWVDPGPLVLK